VSPDAGEALGSAEVGEPIPGEETGHGDHATRTLGSNRLQERFRSRVQGAVEQDVTSGAQEADVQTPGMHVETAVKRRLSGVESP
jgi:hypothetical protein